MARSPIRCGPSDQTDKAPHPWAQQLGRADTETRPLLCKQDARVGIKPSGTQHLTGPGSSEGVQVPKLDVSSGVVFCALSTVTLGAPTPGKLRAAVGKGMRFPSHKSERPFNCKRGNVLCGPPFVVV